MKLNKTYLFVVLLLVLPISACNNNNNNNKTGLPPDPNDWVCPDTVIELTQQEINNWCNENEGSGIPAPPNLRDPAPLSDINAKNSFDKSFEAFVRDRDYDTQLNWARDMNWRMTGPYLGMIGFGEFFGVHSTAVRIYYSPEVIEWLCGGRVGGLPDGAMIIKEQHPIDSDLGIVTDSEGCMDITVSVLPTSWTYFIKKNEASKDGWYQGDIRAELSGSSIPKWSIGNPPILNKSAITTRDFFNNTGNPPLFPDSTWYPTGYLFIEDSKFPNTVWTYNQYGNWCLNCHASAVSESTFSSLVNVITPGTKFKQFSPNLITLEDPNYDGLLHIPQRIALFFIESQQEDGFMPTFGVPLSEPTEEFLEFYNQIPEVTFQEAWALRLPAETYDHQVSFAEGPPKFLTSDQCIGCHDGTFINFSLPNMLFEEKNIDGTITRYNLSPYSEWKASPLGQAGRDPIFFAQVESETNFFAGGLAGLPDPTACIETTCLHCHGVMGQRQLQIDTLDQDDEMCKDLFGITPPPEVPFGEPLPASAVTEWPGSNPNMNQRYGSLARDGISCTVCHHIVDTGFGTDNIYTGNFVTGPSNEIYGPYQQVVTKPMQNSIGIEPKFGSQTLKADICATCHNILLPVVTNEGELLGFSYEQTTDLEWQNSDYATGRPLEQTCQGCHMPTKFHGEELKFKIANIESTNLPPTSNRLPDNEIELTERNRYARHSLHGLNVFLNEMFQEFPLILGIRQIDFMTGVATVPALTAARESFIDMAENQTAEIDIQSLDVDSSGIRAEVKVTNKVGHYLPSGVAFRRVFIEFVVKDSQGNVLWASGSTNSVGAIIDGATGEVLPSELPLENPMSFQPHYQTITGQDEVQIYQEVVTDSENELTTSFLRRVNTLKNNRLRPKGFNPNFFATSPSEFVQELAIIPGNAANDPYYTDPLLTGADIIVYEVDLTPQELASAATVEVKLFNQSIPPFYLQQRFNDANVGAAENDQIRRLYYLTSHLNTDVTDSTGKLFIKDWKLMLATDSRNID